MFLYIDIAYEVETDIPGKAPGDVITSDHTLFQSTPPCFVTPYRIAVSLDGGKPDIYNGVRDFASAIDKRMATDRSILSGWNLDRVLIPTLGAAALRAGVRLPRMFLRDLGEKWSRPAGHSIERMFYQGWYDTGPSRSSPVTLDEAASVLGMPAVHSTEADDLLACRIELVHRMHARYLSL